MSESKKSFRARAALAAMREGQHQANVDQARRLKNFGMKHPLIALLMGVPESSVRSLIRGDRL